MNTTKYCTFSDCIRFPSCLHAWTEEDEKRVGQKGMEAREFHELPPPCYRRTTEAPS